MEVEIQQRSTGHSSSAKIPALYHPHLTWIRWESSQNTPRSKWLQNVLDFFVQELHEIQSDVDSSWRSLSLNSLLIRTFDCIPHEDENAIMRMAPAKIDPGLDQFDRLDQWLRYYTRIDAVGLGYKPRWMSLKPYFFSQNGEATSMEEILHSKHQLPGMTGCLRKL